jgi:protein O-mannosyl-transferase
MTGPASPARGIVRGRRLTFHRVAAALVAAWTVIVFLPTLRNEFVEWDDVRMFLENPYHRGSWAMRLRGAWATHLLGEYMPVTWTSYALDRALWDFDAAGYHLTSLALHVGATLAVYAVAWRLLGLARGERLDDRGRALAAAAAALAFGVHPLRAEPVGWLSARGTVLGGLLLVLAVLAYLAGWERGRAEGRVPGAWLAGVAGLFVASVLARATGLVLPGVLLLLDIYPLRRIPGPLDWNSRAGRRVLAEKVGLSVVGVLAIPMGFLARSNRPLEFWRVEYDPLLAGAWSLYSAAFYVWKTLWPWQLGPIYGMPTRASLGGGEMVLAVATVVGITAVALAVRHRCPAFLAAWAAYLIILAPMSGLVPFGRLLGVVDRYSYAATIGWAIVAGGAVAVAWERWTPGNRRVSWPVALTMAVASVGLVCWSLLTWRQVQIWRDSTSLWAQAVEVSPTCVRCHVNLGNRLGASDGGVEALAHYERALSLAPEQVDIHTNMGLLLVRVGRPAEAIPHYELVLARYPDRLVARVNLVRSLVDAGRLPEAVARLDEASSTSSPGAQLEYFEQMTRAEPTAPVAWLGLFLAAARAGDQARARAAYATLAGLHAELAALALRSTEHAQASRGSA